MGERQRHALARFAALFGILGTSAPRALVDADNGAFGNRMTARQKQGGRKSQGRRRGRGRG